MSEGLGLGCGSGWDWSFRFKAAFHLLVVFHRPASNTKASRLLFNSTHLSAPPGQDVLCVCNCSEANPCCHLCDFYCLWLSVSHSLYRTIPLDSSATWSSLPVLFECFCISVKVNQGKQGISTARKMPAATGGHGSNFP